jgi:ribosomal protein S18 acetylase RimI-like enzyme
MRDRPGATICLASHEDASRLLELEALCFEMEPNVDTTYFWTPVVEYLWTYKAEVRRKIVGGVIAMPTREGTWYVNSLFVHPRYRKRGIATQLLRQVLRVARGRSVVLDVKTDRPSLLDFYRNFGFTAERILPNYYRDGTDRILLVRKNARRKARPARRRETGTK